MLPNCQQLLDIARRAGKRILEIYATEFAVAHKADQSPVTEADNAAHDIIAAALAELTPDLPLLSEEGGLPPFEVRRTWPCYWLVDPLDGTREFVKRNDEFSVNIALVQQHEPVLGVVYAPVTGIGYYAQSGSGAFKKLANGQTMRIVARRLGQLRPVIARSRSHPSHRLQAFLDRLGEHTSIQMGSALKSCLVAEGKVDLYPRLGPTSEWDTAAAQCILEEAGGHLTDTEMQPLRYNQKESLVNPHFFAFGIDSRDWSQYLK